MLRTARFWIAPGERRGARRNRANIAIGLRRRGPPSPDASSLVSSCVVVTEDAAAFGEPEGRACGNPGPLSVTFLCV